MALEVTRREQEGIAILELTGRLKFGPEDMLLNDEIRHALAARRLRLVVDLNGVDKIDSAGLGTLLYARAELRRAGGGLALAMLLSLRDAGVALPAAVALFSPWTDLAATGESLVTNDQSCALFHGANIGLGALYYLGAADPRDPLASPLYGNLTGLPPMLIHVGKGEVLLDDSTRLAARARVAGVRVELKVWPVVPHDWQLVPTMPEARKSLREASEFLLS